jgi:hypothetical protein
MKKGTYSKTIPAKNRRRIVLTRLQEQLKSGKKPERVDGNTTTKMVALGDKDKSRIEKEITTLESRT